MEECLHSSLPVRERTFPPGPATNKKSERERVTVLVSNSVSQIVGGCVYLFIFYVWVCVEKRHFSSVFTFQNVPTVGILQSIMWQMTPFMVMIIPSHTQVSKNTINKE